MTARHSTGVTEPVPAVDVDLIRDLGKALNLIDGPTYAADGRDLLASEPMQRLRVAWTAEAERQYAGDVEAAQQLYTQLEERYGEANQERDEAQEELEDHVAAGVGQEQVAAFLAWKRDGGAAAVQESGRSRSEIGALTAEVERLRAAVPDLPDVGPVTWKGDTEQRFVTVAGLVFRAQEDHRTHAALRLAVAAFLDREAEERAAADTTTEAPSMITNDEFEAVQYALPPGIDFAAISAAIRALDAHRARTHWEGA